MSENNLKTPDELKEEKNEKIRKNLRLIAIFVALWYFISAGWGWYEEIQKEEAQQEVAAVLQSENTLYNALKQNLGTILPFDANSVLGVSDNITLEPTRNEDKINGIIINLHDKSTVDDKTYDTIFSLITTLECGEQKSDPKEIMELAENKCIVNPCTSEEYKTPAKRPEYSSLDNMMLRCTIGDEMRDWKEALKSFFKNQQRN